MPSIPFLCTRCGNRFTEGGFSVGEGATDILVSGAQVECGRCGAMAKQDFPAVPFNVRGGRFVFAGSIARLLVAARREADVTDYDKLVEVSRAALAATISNEDWVDAVQSTPFRDLIRIWERLPAHKRVALHVLIGLILWLQPQLFPLPRLGDDPPTQPPAITSITDEQADEIARRILEGVEGQRTAEPSPTPTVDRPSRNSPCPCGRTTPQGKSVSYKRCHGAPAR